MAFSKSKSKKSVPASPVELFRSLPRRKYPTEMPHQGAILESYAASYTDKKDVALQLPTGSGKTLVGLLIAEWRRRKYGEKVVYVCPTRQLVNQTVEQADKKYGLDVLNFSGGIRDFTPDQKAQYQAGMGVAVTTFNGVFNTNPYFRNPDTIIIDDSHASENYLASMWSLEINPSEEKQKALHSAIMGVIKPYVSKQNFGRMLGNWNSGFDAGWVDKLPTPDFLKIKDELFAVLETHTPNTQLQYPWSLIRGNLHACQMYIGASRILIRPLIPPTWSHAPFDNAGHRIYMSATLGQGGDLERLTGRSNITRMPIPEGFELQGVGRRFFMFPGMSLEGGEYEDLRLDFMRRVPRSVMLTPSGSSGKKYADEVKNRIGYKVYNAKDIEASKSEFVSGDKRVAIMAGRYDGIDFPLDECRLLFVDGLPRAMNIQERFLMSRMGATVLFNERIQTRVMQAIGRCTRALQDSSAVFITGAELQDYLVDPKRRKHFHPELQAELEFGVDESMSQSVEGFKDNFQVFFDNGKDWAEANDSILSRAKEFERVEFPAMDELSAAVKYEVKYQKAMWDGDYVRAFSEAKNVLTHLKASELKGYRALWYYLAGSAASMAFEQGESGMDIAAREQFSMAKKSTSSLPWMINLTRFGLAEESSSIDVDLDLAQQIENLEAYLCKLGTTHEGKFAKLEKSILEGIETPETFENAHCELGALLGFRSGNHESEGSPDPYWIGKNKCIVFEDHAKGDPKTVLGSGKARQAAGHPKWMVDNVPETSDMEFLPILVSPVQSAGNGALSHLKTVYFWHLDDFKKWARNSMLVIRELRANLSGPGDMVWRAQASEKLEANNMSITMISNLLKDRVASRVLNPDNPDGL